MGIRKEINDVIVARGGKPPVNGGIAASIDALSKLPPSWNDLTDKPFGETEETVSETLNITWDGNTEGLVNVQGALYKVSDVVVANIEDVKNLAIKMSSQEDEFSVADSWDNMVAQGTVTDDCVYSDGFAVARKDGATLSVSGLTLVFPEKGVYFQRVEGLFYIEYLKSSVPISVVKTETKTLDPKYLPQGVGGAFVVTFGMTSDGAVTADKTWQEIYDAYFVDGKQVSGVLVNAHNDHGFCQLTGINGDDAIFIYNQSNESEMGLIRLCLSRTKGDVTLTVFALTSDT